ncbi:MAG: ornithine cyclodeaminase family protein [Solirubrobacterales bacterium]
MDPDGRREFGGIRWVGGSELLGTLTAAAAADALTAALREPASIPAAPQRNVIGSGAGYFLSMPAAGGIGAGAKLVSVQPDNPARGLPLIQGVFALFAPDSLTPVALFDGAAITELRAPAVSLVATRSLARADATHLVLFGAGVQARAHGLALIAERPLERVTVVAPGPGTDTLVRELAAADVDAVRGGPDAVAEADLICTCTSSSEPVFDGAIVAVGAHVNAVGSFRRTTREIDTTLLERSTVFVEDREAALDEAGDLRIPIAEGRFAPESIAADLAEVVSGERGRSSDEEITVFKSVGSAWEDLVVARAAYELLEPTT